MKKLHLHVSRPHNHHLFLDRFTLQTSPLGFAHGPLLLSPAPDNVNFALHEVAQHTSFHPATFMHLEKGTCTLCGGIMRHFKHIFIWPSFMYEGKPLDLIFSCKLVCVRWCQATEKYFYSTVTISYACDV